MAGQPPPNLLNAEQIRVLLERVPERIRNPEPGDQDYRPETMVRSGFDIRNVFGNRDRETEGWTKEERDALEASFKYYTGQDIRLGDDIHRSEYERLEAGLRAAGPIGTEPVADAAVISADGPRNYDLDLEIVNRIISDLSEARVHGTGLSNADVNNLRALYVAYGMEDQVYDPVVSNVGSTETTGGVENAPDNQYTRNELRLLATLKQEIIGAQYRARFTPAAPIVDETVTDGGARTEIVEDDTLTGDELREYNDGYEPGAVEVSDLDPIDTGEGERVVEREETIEPPPVRMTIVESGQNVAPISDEVGTVQTVLAEAGYDIGVYPEGHEKAGEPLTDKFEGEQTRVALIQAAIDMELVSNAADAETYLRRTPITEFAQVLNDNKAALTTLNAERAAERTIEEPAEQPAYVVDPLILS